MPNWRIKAMVQRGLGVLPKPQLWNELFQKHVTRSLGLNASDFEYHLELCRRYVEDFHSVHTGSDSGFTVFELGTGWYPSVPIGLRLCGATEIWTCDIVPLLRRERLGRLLKYYRDYHDEGRLSQHLPALRPECVEMVRQALNHVEHEPPEAVLARLDMHAMVRDAQSTELASQSVDLVFSNTVLQYIPAPVLAKMLAEFKRIARPNAVMVHYIDLRDQYSTFDNSISPLNFLRYSDRAWRWWWRSPLTPLNRLRLSDYRRLITGAGFEIVREVNTSAPPEELDRIPLAPEFQKYTREDLLVLNSRLICRVKPP